MMGGGGGMIRESVECGILLHLHKRKMRIEVAYPIKEMMAPGIFGRQLSLNSHCKSISSRNKVGGVTLKLLCNTKISYNNDKWHVILKAELIIYDRLFQLKNESKCDHTRQMACL